MNACTDFFVVSVCFFMWLLVSCRHALNMCEYLSALLLLVFIKCLCAFLKTLCAWWLFRAVIYEEYLRFFKDLAVCMQTLILWLNDIASRVWLVVCIVWFLYSSCTYVLRHSCIYVLRHSCIYVLFYWCIYVLCYSCICVLLTRVCMWFFILERRGFSHLKLMFSSCSQVRVPCTWWTVRWCK
jgi:hypothetical protein